jgi:hypothetical protein
VNEDNKILASNDDVTISRTGNGESFTAKVSGEYARVEWFVNGALESNAKTVGINATDYRIGTYRLGVIVVKDNVSYGTEITFTVTK